jgi:DNA-binding NarL/FixJ family response regulator
MIRILLVDDQNLMRQGLKVLLAQIPELQIVGTAKDGLTALKQVEVFQPDLVLIDIEMPIIDGLTTTRLICRHFPKTKVLALSSYEKEEYVWKAIKAGAKGYLLKNSSTNDLARAIKAIYRGYSQFESGLLAKVIAAKSTSSYDNPKQKSATALPRDILPPKKLSNQPKNVDSSSTSLAANINNFSTTLVNAEIEFLSGESLDNTTAPPSQNPKKSSVGVCRSSLEPIFTDYSTEENQDLINNQITPQQTILPSKNFKVEPDLILLEQKSLLKKQVSTKAINWWILGIGTAVLVVAISVIISCFIDRHNPIPSFFTKNIHLRSN